MDITYIFANALVLFFLMDPCGNLPVFVSILQQETPKNYRRIIIRECLIALIILFAAAFLGSRFMRLMGLTPGILRLSGGLILLILGIRMVFSSIMPDKSTAESFHKEPFIVPLAVPLICGPGTLAMLMTFLHSSPQASVCNVAAAVVLGWFAQGVILLFGQPLSRLLGNKVLDALESLMGLLLATLATGMLVSGIRECFGFTGIQ